MRRYRSTVSANGVRFIADFEGFRSRPYLDAVGVWTIGYGHTKGVSAKSKPLSEAQARALLLKDLNEQYAPAVAKRLRACKMRTSQGEFNALVSAVYNLGTGILQSPRSIGMALYARDRKRVGEAFLLYDKAGGHALPGLTRRRRAERRLWLTGQYPW